MENRGSMYRMKEFSAMTGLPQSKIRFYEKHGLILSDRQENGYRVFTPEDAFKSNAFRVLLQYGFSIDEAVACSTRNKAQKSSSGHCCINKKSSCTKPT